MDIYKRMSGDLQRYMIPFITDNTQTRLMDIRDYSGSTGYIRCLFISLYKLDLSRKKSKRYVSREYEVSIVSTKTKNDFLYRATYRNYTLRIEANSYRDDYDENIFKTFIYFKILDLIVNLTRRTIHPQSSLKYNYVNPTLPLRKNLTQHVYCLSCNSYVKTSYFNKHTETMKHMSNTYKKIDKEQGFYVPLIFYP